ncbi:MAG TPA: hypothetical protein DIV86_03100 [Alphaproteobacteria bacterium]|nr:hypothetical protein [Alphaproteobacteria bacterium]
MRKKHINFIEHIRGLTGLSLSAIARQADIADTTLTRFMNKAELEALSTQTLDKVAKTGGYRDYEDFLLKNKNTGSTHGKKELTINDAQKFEIYEMARKLLKTNNKNPSPDECSNIASEVIKYMQLLNTDFVSESFVMYVIEKRKEQPSA